mgnify:CR=1 FL=1
MPIEFVIPTLRIQIHERLLEDESQLICAKKLLGLDEQRLDSERHVERDQLRRKAFVDCHSQQDCAAPWEGSPVLVF